MKYKYLIILLIGLLIQLQRSLSQDGAVLRGKVVDAKTEQPLPGVNIVEMDNQDRVIKGVITDVNGNYVLELSNKNHYIRVSFIGYKSQTFEIGSQTHINIDLEEEAHTIEEVVVTAQAQGNTLTGIAERDVTSSTMKIDMDELTGQAGVSVAGALQGQVSGLDIIAASGDPGSGSNIVIRGMGSLGNTNPLIVVDGIPQDIKSDNFNFASADQHDLGQLLNIAPQDIKSVEVLKDASATAIWGSKGANGVLVIETHKGSKGNIQFNYQYKVTANTQPPTIPMLNGDEYITMQLEEGLNAYGIWNVPPEISYDRNFVDFYNYSQNTDWIGKITKDSYTHDHFFNMSGGGRKSMYYTSVNYQKASGTTVNTAFRRLGIRANFNYSISNKLRITTYFSYSNTLKQDNPSISGRNVREMAYIKAPNMSIWEYDQDGELTGEYFTPILSYQGSGSSYYNPVAIADLGKNDTQGNEIQNNFIVDYNILDWLKFKESISFAYINEKGNSFTPASAIGADWLYSGKNNAREKNDINLRLLSRSQLFITPLRSSRDHSLIGVLMWEMEQKKFESMDIVTGNGPTIKIKDPSVGAPTDWMWSGSSQIRLFGAFGSLNYKYKNRYLLSASIRADGSSMFGESNQWGVFPSLSAGWKFSEEGFLSQYAFLNESKLRLSWGRSGKGISEDDPYARYSYYITQGRYMLDPSIVPGQIQLASLKWQTVESWNLGLDLNFFNNRLYVKGDVYDKITFDLLWNDYDIPGTTGYNELEYFNGGSISNRGWEFYTRGVLIDREKLLFSLNFNISQNINRFISFPENFKKQRGISISNGEFPKKAEIGKPIGSFYGFRYLGVYPSDEHAVAKDENGNILVDANGEPIPMTYMETYEFKGGDAIYEDINHDGKIDLMDVVYIGDSSPLFIGGFGSTLKYKSFGISLNFHYRLGFDIINKVAIETEGMLNKNNQSKAVLHRWKREGQEGEGMLPRAYMNHPANNLGSDRYVEPGDFLRLNTINFTYRLNPRLAKRMNLSSLEIGIMIRKLLTFTNYTGQDPEIGRVGLDPFWLGLDEARTPAPKEYSLRFNLNF